MRGLAEAGFAYGLYSYTAGWDDIVGNWFLPTVPVWATAGSSTTPPRRWTAARSAASPEAASTSPSGDATRAVRPPCSWYCFQPPQIPRAIDAGSLNVWDATGADAVPR